MRHRKHMSWRGCLVGALLPLVAGAQTYHLAAGSMDGSGGTAAGGAYVLGGTVGQADAAHWNGGPYEVTAGFWMVGILPTPGAPELEILLNGGQLMVRWAAGDEAFVLQRITDLTSGRWQTIPGPYPEMDGTHEVVLPLPINHEMYRLQSPAQ